MLNKYRPGSALCFEHHCPNCSEFGVHLLFRPGPHLTLQHNREQSERNMPGIQPKFKGELNRCVRKARIRGNVITLNYQTKPCGAFQAMLEEPGQALKPKPRKDRRSTSELGIKMTNCPGQSSCRLGGSSLKVSWPQSPRWTLGGGTPYLLTLAMGI